MSVFSDNITNNTDLQSFHDYWKKCIEDQFDKIYNNTNRDLTRVSSIFNGVLNKTKIQKLFEERKIYHPYFHCQFLVGEDYFGYISIKISYSDDPIIYVQDKAKIFLSLNLPIPKLS